jgi:hypothetical protein
MHISNCPNVLRQQFKISLHIIFADDSAELHIFHITIKYEPKLAKVDSVIDTISKHLMCISTHLLLLMLGFTLILF